MRHLAVSLTMFAAFIASLGGVAAQAFPSRPITLIVPFAAGGPTDAFARILAQAMSGSIKQSVVIENVPGAGGATGAQRLIRAQPDGYTVLITDLALPAGPLMNANVTYDLGRDIAPIRVINAGPMVLISRKGLVAAGEGLFNTIRKRGDTLNLGHSGPGSNSHLCGLLVQQALGIRMTEVPYRGQVRR